MSSCIECLRDFHDVCGSPCCCASNPLPSNSADSDEISDEASEPRDTDEDSETEDRDSRNGRKVNPAYDTSDPEANWRVSEGRAKRGKRDAALKDQQSTGRKRAAKLYPLSRDEACEWRGLILAGGGTAPIIGCIDGMQSARHHGPDKNTLNNEEGNVHRICHTCHNRWHAANDPDYIPGKPVTD